MKKGSNKKGFTLIELMVVVAIVAVLAAIAIPSYISYKRQSQKEVARTSVSAIVDSLNGYTANHGVSLDIVNNNGTVVGTFDEIIDLLAANELYVTVDGIKLDAPASTFCTYHSESRTFTLNVNATDAEWQALCDDGDSYVAP
ncbi:MAG: prepilin-type N-terminal cleavage/methylation domain-containing protein [Clostridia bacterium]|nr:prepilin-type N-terminal cleavage/methylation domain-containing protein [Clostridia bacterium]